MSLYNMRSEEIKSKMIILKKKQNKIAEKAKVSPAAINMVISGRTKSRRLQAFIAREIGMEYCEVWGKGAA